MSAPGALAPLRVAPFRWLVLGATVSRLGSSIAPVALAFAVLDLTGSATALGLVVGARSISNVAFLLLGGVLADRLPRGVVLVGSSVASFATQACVAVLVFARVDTLALLVILSAVNGAVSAFALPASAALLPQTVGPAELVPANALSRLGDSAATVLGVSIAGIVVAVLGSGWGIAIDAATFAAAAGFFALVRVPALERDERHSVWRDLAGGWAAFRSRQWLWVVVAAFGVLNAAEAGTITVLGPVVADGSIGRPAWGLVLAAESVGYVLGGLLAIRLRLHRLLRYGMACMLTCALPPLALTAADTLGAPGLVAAFVFAGFGIEQFGVAWQTTMQTHIPADLLARVTSYDMLGSFVAIPAGQLLAGPARAAFGLTAALIGASVVIAVAVLGALASRDVRTLEQPGRFGAATADPVG